MAGHLLTPPINLAVWNRSGAAADDLVAAGATRAASVADAAHAEIAVTMVADDAAVEEIAWKGRLLELLPRGAIHLSMSTISVALAEKLTAAHAARGSVLVSAPVFGRPEAAAAAKLFIVAAGPPAALDRCEPLFAAMGQRTFRIGEEPRLANVVKLSGNFLIASIIESLAEAFALVRKSGVDPHQYLEVLTGTLFAAPIFRTYGSLIAERRYQPAGFKMPLGLKDVTLALDAARAATVPMPVASVIRDHMIAALARGYGDFDWSALGELAALNAGLSS
jgi:3-hydroxyisobutyrate dehydrogenase-like beta-hydroxyacid dehydrogenase